jgi:hypothetical protein
MVNHGVFHEGRCFHFVFLVLDLLETLVDLLSRSDPYLGGNDRALKRLREWALSWIKRSKDKSPNLPGCQVYCARLPR